MSPEFAITEHPSEGDRHVLAVRGEIDLFTAPELKQVLAESIENGRVRIVIDLTETTFLDSSGARQLVGLARSAKAAGVALQVVCPPDNRPVRLVVDLLELHALVPIVESAGAFEGEAGP